ncbi:MAG: hypothetical protein Q9207_002214 [Kuettlingeria erythrocarpa]
MGKREREVIEGEVSKKRRRLGSSDRLSALSDELLLVLLSYLPVTDLTRCGQLSRRLKALASDSQLWKSAYYERFVRPRAVRIPGLREAGTMNKSLLYSSKLSKWLEDGRLVRDGGATNWKRQYKLRHNWSRGSCKRSETVIATCPSTPPVLVRLHEGAIITADCAAGLRAWSTQGDESLIATLAWGADGQSSSAPSSLAIDMSSANEVNFDISVGFLDGSFGIYALDRRQRSITCQYMHPSSTNGAVTAIALSFPYILTMTEAQLLSIYVFPLTEDQPSRRSALASPRLLSSLRSHTAWPPLSLGIRCSSVGISISVAYAMPTFMAGWSVGLQELRLTAGGMILESRLATPLSEGFVPLTAVEQRAAQEPLKSQESASFLGRGPRSSSLDVSRPWFTTQSTKPTSLSYSHPYLLTAHSDNTMTLYVVTSNAQELFIGAGRQLWGHTSSVSGAHVGDRGKAVSVSVHSDDIRVWELESGIVSSTTKRRTQLGAAKSVAIKPDGREGATPFKNAPSGEGPASPATKELDVATLSQGWLSFDEEQVVLLGEGSQGAQALVMYNFA